MKYRILKDELKRNTRRCAVFGHWRHNSLVKPEKRLFGQSVVDNFVYKSCLKYSNTLAEMQSSRPAHKSLRNSELFLADLKAFPIRCMHCISLIHPRGKRMRWRNFVSHPCIILRQVFFFLLEVLLRREATSTEYFYPMLFITYR